MGSRKRKSLSYKSAKQILVSNVRLICLEATQMIPYSEGTGFETEQITASSDYTCSVDFLRPSRQMLKMATAVSIQILNHPASFIFPFHESNPRHHILHVYLEDLF
jgi:hypothetical protein